MLLEIIHFTCYWGAFERVRITRKAAQTGNGNEIEYPRFMEYIFRDNRAYFNYFPDISVRERGTLAELRIKTSYLATQFQRP